MHRGVDELSAVTNVVKENMLLTEKFGGGPMRVVTSVNGNPRSGLAIRMVINWSKQGHRVDIRAGKNGLTLKNATGAFSALSRTPSGADVAQVLRSVIALHTDAELAEGA